ncbi:MAG: hypothetical protein GY737_14030 [Desulfobacteraceae bacterium]|nr:hypothetical protein [Desulfobacteraceae bacterium]
MKKPKFVLTWANGHKLPRPVYYRETEAGHNACTYTRDDAQKFPSSKAALQTWRNMHARPEEFEHCITAGHVRAERADQPEFWF